jgi:predicted naringenin-chalcone synthase
MSFAILGLGTAVPAATLTQEEALGLARVLCCRTPEQNTWVPLMYAQTDIDTRHFTLPRQLIDDVLAGTRHSGSIFLPTGRLDDAGPTTGQRMRVYAQDAGPLALQAARAALDQARLRPEQVTHLVTVSCTGFAAPGVDLALIRGLGLSSTVQRTHVGFMGCHGAINGLRVVAAFGDADGNAVVLLCAVELTSLHYHYGWDPQRIVANALFADGAAAVAGTAASSQTPAGTWRVRATGSCVVPNSAEAMTWTIGDNGFEMTLSKRVPQLIATNLRPWLEAWLCEYGITRAEVASWAIHPGGPRILGAVEESLGLRPEQTADARAVFAEYGNMSSPTVLFIVDRLRRRQAPRPCVALGFGPGLVAEAALLD